MTDLDELAEQVIEALERVGSPLTVEQDDDAKGIIRSALQSAHAAGHIVGLEEAAPLAVDAKTASRLLRGVGEVSSLAVGIDCGERADAIDARVQTFRAR